jgi:hypothetical protein
MSTPSESKLPTTPTSTARSLGPSYRPSGFNHTDASRTIDDFLAFVADFAVPTPPVSTVPKPVFVHVRKTDPTVYKSPTSVCTCTLTRICDRCFRINQIVEYEADQADWSSDDEICDEYYEDESGLLGHPTEDAYAW